MQTRREVDSTMRKKKCSRFLLTFLLAVCVISLAVSSADAVEKWQKTFGGKYDDWGNSVQQTKDGGYIIVGFTNSFGAPGYNVYLLKTDAKGNSLWQKTIGGNLHEYGYSVQQTTDDGYIIVGYTNSFGAGNNDVYLIKTDSKGNRLWRKTFGGTKWDYGYCVRQTKDGGYIIAGTTDSYGTGKTNVYLIKTDPKGNSLWEKTFAGTEWATGASVQQTKDGGYIVVGNTGYGTSETNVYLIKTDANGNGLWENTFAGDGWAYGVSVQQTKDGGYIIAGLSHGGGASDGYLCDVYLIKTGAKGKSLWEKTFGGTKADAANSVQQTTDGGYVIVGYTNSFGAGASDVYLIKTDVNGSRLWQKAIGGRDSDWANSVQQTTDGGYIIVGASNSFTACPDSLRDVYLIKTDANGNSQ